VSLPDDNVVERGRAIFEQLRSAERDGPAPADEPAPVGDGDAGPVGAADPVAETDDDTNQVPAAETGTGTSEEEPAAGVEDATDQEVPPAGAEVSSIQTGPGAGPELSPTVIEPAAEGATASSSAEQALAADPAPAPESIEVPRSRTPGPVPLGMPPEAVASLMGDDTGAVTPAELSPTRFARPLPRVIAIANQKGGVGKTTTAVNLGAGLAELGYRVLVVDLDPQGNATTGLGINPRNLETSIYDVMMHDVALEDCIEATTLRNLFVCPATIDLAGAEIELVPAFSRELKLRRALEPVLEDFDFVVVDCPPSLGLITVNALAAATEVIVPIQCEYYALEGLGQLLRNVNLVQTNLNPRLEVSAIVLTMFDARTKLADQVATEVRGHFGAKVCRNIVPRTVRLSEAPSFGQPIVVFDPTSRGAIAYRELAKEVAGGAPQRVG
jgi:chromosome partitioning protein